MTIIKILRLMIIAAALSGSNSSKTQVIPPVATPAPDTSIYLIPEQENPTGAEIIKFAWDYMKINLNNLRVKVSTVSKSSYDLFFHIGSTYDDTYIFRQNGNSTDIISFNNYFYESVGSPGKDGYQQRQQYVLSYPEQNLESANSILITKLEKRYGEEVIFYSVSPDNKAIFIVTKHLFILAELEENEISRDVVSVERISHTIYSPENVTSLYWAEKNPAPENKVQYYDIYAEDVWYKSLGHTLGESSIQSLLQNKAYYIRLIEGKERYILDMYSHYQGGAHFESENSSIYLLENEEHAYREVGIRRGIYTFKQFKNPDNKTQLKKINNVIRKIADEYLNRNSDLEEIDAATVSAFTEESYDELYITRPPGFIDVIDIIVNDVNRVSIRRPRKGGEIINFNGNGDIMTLDDIFKVDEEIYLQRLVDISKETIENDIGTEDFENQEWYFNIDRLKNMCAISENSIITFHGSVSSSYSGKSEHIVVIPFSLISDILSDEYK